MQFSYMALSEMYITVTILWIGLICNTATQGDQATSASPELVDLPAHTSDGEDDKPSSDPIQLAAELPKNNDGLYTCPRTSDLQKFKDLSKSFDLDDPSLSSEEARPPQIHLNVPWGRFITRVVEYLYYGDSRHSVFANSQDGKSNSLRESERWSELEMKKRAAQPRHKVNCSTRSTTQTGVMLVNDTSLQKLLSNEKSSNDSTRVSTNTTCQILLLFAPWCPFSAALAPHYNALGRLFPNLEALAIDAVTLNYWNARFGTVAVPNVLLFHSGKFIAKYNYTEKNVESLTYFVQNFTNLSISGEMMLSEEDYMGPVPTEQVLPTDYYLMLSWAVIIYALGHAGYIYSAPFVNLYHRVSNVFNYDHNHLD